MLFSGTDTLTRKTQAAYILPGNVSPRLCVLLRTLLRNNLVSTFSFNFNDDETKP